MHRRDSEEVCYRDICLLVTNCNVFRVAETTSSGNGIIEAYSQALRLFRIH